MTARSWVLLLALVLGVLVSGWRLHILIRLLTLSLVVALVGAVGWQLGAALEVFSDPLPSVTDALTYLVTLAVLGVLLVWRGAIATIRTLMGTLVIYAVLGAFALAVYGITGLLGNALANPTHPIGLGWLYLGVVVGALADLIIFTLGITVAWRIHAGSWQARPIATAVGVAIVAVLFLLSAREVPGEESFTANLSIARGQGTFDVLVVVDPSDAVGRRLIRQADRHRLQLSAPRRDRPGFNVRFELAVLRRSAGGARVPLYEVASPQPGARESFVSELAGVAPERGPPHFRSYGRLLFDAQQIVAGIKWRSGASHAVVFASSRLPTEEQMTTPPPTAAETERACRANNQTEEAREMCRLLGQFSSPSFPGFDPAEPVTFGSALNSFVSRSLAGESSLVLFGRPSESLSLFMLSGDHSDRTVDAWRQWTSTTGGRVVDPDAYGSQLLLHTIEDAVTDSPIQAATDLAAIYRPHLRFDLGERSFPVDVDTLLRGGGSGEEDNQVCNHRPGPDDCAQIRNAQSLLGSRHEYINFAGEVRLGPLVRDDRDAGLPPRAYFHVVRQGSSLYLDYWWFFRINLSPYQSRRNCLPGFTVSDLTCFDHEGDWEGVTVALRFKNGHNPASDPDRPAAYDPDAWMPDWVAYDAHGRSVRWSWDRLSEAGVTAGMTHPEVYVASGSHASYPLPCFHKCHENLNFHPHLPEGDFDGENGWAFNDPGACEQPCLIAMPSVRRFQPYSGIADRLVDPAAWNAFPGRWGAARCIHIAKVCTQSDGPKTPSNQGRYTKPWGAELPPKSAVKTFGRLAADLAKRRALQKKESTVP